jgi:hypothetical protein
MYTLTLTKLTALTNSLTVENSALAISKLALAKVTGAATASLKLFMLSIKALKAVLKAFFISNPFGWILAAVTGLIYGITKLISSFQRLKQVKKDFAENQFNFRYTPPSIDLEQFESDLQALQNRLGEKTDLMKNEQEKELEALRSLQQRKQAIAKVDYEVELNVWREFLAKKAITLEQYEARVNYINEQWTVKNEQISQEFQTKESQLLEIQQQERNEQQLEEYRNSVEIAQMRYRLELISQADLKNVINDYYQWTKNVYAQDSREYLKALETRRNAEVTPRDDQLERLKESLKNETELLIKRQQDELLLINERLEKRVINQEEFNELELNLISRHQEQLNSIAKKDFEHNLRLAEQKYQLGLNSLTEIELMTRNYYNWVIEQYDQDSKEYLDALNMKNNAEKKVNDERMRLINENFNQQMTMYDLNLINLEEMRIAHQNYVKSLIEIRDNVDELSSEYQELTIKITQANNKMKNMETAFPGEQLKLALEQLKEQIGILGDAALAAIQSIENGMVTMFSKMIVEGEKFKDVMKSMWKSLVTAIINEISKAITKWMIFKALTAAGGAPALPFFGFKDGGFVTPVKANTGGFISGAGTATSDSIPAMLSNGEYVINAHKTNIFKPLLDLINYAPLHKLANLQSFIWKPDLPRLNIPLTPKFAYNTGGYVNGGFNLGNLQKSIELMSAKLENRLIALEKKDYQVLVKTNFKGVEFAREIDRAQEAYRHSIV